MNQDELIERILTARDQMLQHSIEANSVTLNGWKYGKLIENLPPNIKPTIFGMAMKAEYAMPDDYDFLVQYEPPHPQTNADRIRSMADEELADYFSELSCWPNARREVCRGMANCMDCWLDWLKSPAEEGE